jgi:hypothetical protein
MKKFKLILLAFFVFAIKNANAQDSTLRYGTPIVADKSIPVSWIYLDTTYTYTDTSQVFNATSGSNFRQALNTFSLPAYNNTTLQNYADSIKKNCSTCGFSNYYGYGNETTIDLKTSAQYYNPHIAGGKLWILRVTSATALGLQFYFSKLMIPSKSFLHIYSADKKKLIGPYTSDDTPSDSTKAIHFGAVPIIANDVFLEYYESDSANYTGTLKLANEAHVFSANFGKAASCQTDIGCQTLSVGWDNEVSSMALILAYDKNKKLLQTCSGNLINTTYNATTAAIPPLYFLTAGHCLYSSISGSAYDESTWQFVFDYQNACCNGDGTDPGFGKKVLHGVKTLLSYDNMTQCGDTAHDYAEYGTSDYALLELNPPKTFNTIVDWSLCFAGWSVDDPTNDDVFTLIHHPKGDVMKICQGTNLVDPANAVKCSIDSSYRWSIADFYNVDFENTTTGGSPEVGSSGAGLFDGNNHLVATVTGANLPATDINACSASTDQESPDGTFLKYFFGRFKRQFPNFTYYDFSSRTTKNWLDPDGQIYNYYAVNAQGVVTPAYTGTRTDVDSYCPNTNGTDLIVCPGTNTTTTNNNGIDYVQDCNHELKGLNINGLSGIPALCAGSSYYFGGHDFLWFLLPGHVSYSYNDYLNYYNATGQQPCAQGISWGCGGVFGPCYYWTGGYEVDIIELDFNLNPVGNYYKKEYILNSLESGGPDKVDCGQWMWGFYKIAFTPSDLGVTIQPGHFYSFGMSANGISGYTNASQVVYIMPNTYNANNTTLGDATNSWDARDIYATTDIVIDNTTVLANVNEVAAGNYIDIQNTATSGNSDLQGGHYFIKNIACNTSHREANPNNHTAPKGNVTSNIHSIQSQVKNTYIQNPVLVAKNSAPSFLIYPNPANNNIVVEFNDQAPKFNNTATVIIYNSIGGIVKNESRTIYQSQMGLEVDGLTPGMYNIVITQGNKTWQSKFVKQ